MSFLYREAGRILQGVESGKASLKTLTLGRANGVGGGKGGDENGPKRKLYAMVSETLRYKPLLDKLVLKVDPKGTLFSDEHMREKAQGYVMLYEILLGKGSIQGGGKLKRHLMQYKARLEECLAEAKAAEGLPADAANEKLLPKSARRHIFPRYARVNLVTCPEGVKSVAETLRKEGFTVKIDDVVPSLLVLPAGTDLHDHPMVKDGRLVLQDKSSCFSAEALLGKEAYNAPTMGVVVGWKGGDVIDACAAPGNKTMHAASLLFSQGASSSPTGKKNSTSTTSINNSKRQKVFAFDKDTRRLALMRRRVDEASGAGAGTGAIETHLQDFLEVDPADKRFSKVTAILLDPSCSGSGIVSAPDRLHDNNQEDAELEGGLGVGGGGRRGGGGEKSRVGRLAAFQLQGLLKAMSFPQVLRICYSTCSIFPQENEDVVAKALEQQPIPPPTPINNTCGVAQTPEEGSSEPVGMVDNNAPQISSRSSNEKNGCISSSTNSIGGGTHTAEKKQIGGTRTTNAATTTDATTAAAADIATGADDGPLGRFKLSRCLSRWPRRGLAVSGLDDTQAACMIRADPSEDETNGFFVAVFERDVGGAGVGGATKKRRNKNKNRKKNKKKRKLEEAADAGEEEKDHDTPPELSSPVAGVSVADVGGKEAGVCVS